MCRYCNLSVFIIILDWFIDERLLNDVYMYKLDVEFVDIEWDDVVMDYIL